MAIQISGVSMGAITGGPSSLKIEDLADVSVVAPASGNYLRYNSGISEWQNTFIDSDVFDYLDTNLTGTEGVTITTVSGPNTIAIGLGAITPSSVAASGTVTGSNLSGTNTGDQTITLSGDATGSGTGALAVTLATVNATTGTFGSGTEVPVITVNGKGLITNVTTAAFSGTAPTATNLAGGLAGQLPYQSAPNTTSFLAAGTTSQVLIGGASAPAWSNTPALTGTNFTGIPNAGLVNSSVTVGSTAISLGSAATTLAGLSSVTSTTFTGALTGAASDNVLKSGDTMTGNLILNADPTAALGAATKQYVDNIAGGLSAHASCATATTAALPAATYDNGTGGVGATLTADAPGALGTVGGYSGLAVSNRVLVKDQAAPLQNGIYVVTDLGSGGSPWILTRATDFDNSPANEVESGDFTYIRNGTLDGTQWVLVTPGTITIGTTGLSFSQLSGSGTFVGGTGINIAGNIISNTGVTSLAGTASEIVVSAATGAVTLSLPSSITVSGTMTATTFNGNLSGNATTATSATTASSADTLTTPRTIGISGGVTGTATSFDGSANITIPITAMDASSLSTGTVPVARLTGTYNISISGDAATLGGLGLNTTTTNDQVNKVVRTDGSGSVNFGQLSAVSSDNGTTTPTRIYASNDGVIKYYTPANFRTVMGLGSLTGSNTWTGVNQFISTSTTAAGTNPALQAFGNTGNSAYLSFHRGGDYAVNMGLDTDNVLRIGGWSAPANVLQLDMTGNLQPLGYYNVGNFGLGLTGVYSDTRYQNVFSMGSPYRPTADGTGLSNMYGIAWTHPNVGGQSKVGLSHQALFVNGGITQTAIGTGIWTNGAITLGTSGQAVYWSDGNFIRRSQGTYGSIEASGTNNGFSGLRLTSSSDTIVGMYDTGGNGGNYDTTTLWHFYWHRGNQCLGIGGSNTLAGYRARVNGALYVDGAIVATGDVTAFSDVRVKTEIEIIPNALSKVESIRGVTFKRTDENTGNRHAGVIAQEVEAVLPEVIKEGADGMKSVAYGNMVGLLIEAIKELNAKVDSLQAQLDAKG